LLPPIEEGVMGFYIIEGMSAEIWIELWKRGQDELEDYENYSSPYTSDSIFFLTRNGGLITEEYEPIVNPKELEDFSVKLYGKYEYMDEINVTGIVGTIVWREETMNAMEVNSIELIKNLRDRRKNE